MSEREREVAGLRCGEVLDRLSDYFNGELGDEAVRIERHLAGCDWCERFGGRFALAVKSLRQHLSDPEPLDPETEARLARRLTDFPGVG